MQDNYIKGFIKTAAQSATAPRFTLTPSPSRSNGSPLWEDSTMTINVPSTETNPVFTNALKKPFKLQQQEFSKFTPVDPRLLAHFGLLSDYQVRKRIQRIQTGSLKDPLIRANQGSRGSSSAYGKLQKGKVLLDRIPIPVQPDIPHVQLNPRLIEGMPKYMDPAEQPDQPLIPPVSYDKFANPMQAAYVQSVLRAQRKAFLTYGRQPKKPGYQKRFDYSSYKDPTKGIGAQMVRNPKFDALNDKLDTNYMSYINSKAFKDYIADLQRGATNQQALTTYYNSLAASWYGDYRTRPGAKQNAMIEYADKLRNPTTQVANQAKHSDKTDSQPKNKTVKAPQAAKKVR